MGSMHKTGTHEDHGSATILCIDDDVAIVKLLSAIFSLDGHEVIEATNGKAALDALSLATPDIILCDVEMPDMNGLQFLQAVREKHHELDDVPFLFMSGNNDSRDVIQGLELGADDYLIKPFEGDYLKAKTHALLRQTSRMAEKKECEHVKIYRALAHELAKADNKTFEAYDILLDRLDHEYAERCRLRDKVSQLTAELRASKQDNLIMLKKLNQLEQSLNVSIDRLKYVRAQIDEARTALTEDGMGVEDIRSQLDAISKSAGVVVYPATSFPARAGRIA